LIAAVCFFVLKLIFPAQDRFWLIFLYAVPVSCIVLTVFMNLWWNNLLRGISVSALIWSIAACVFFTLRLLYVEYIFIIAGILQIMTILWYILIAKPKRKG